MNSNSKLQKSSSIFLAAVLVAGLIAIASPSFAFASEDDDRKYNVYDFYDPPYTQDKKYEKPSWGYNKVECSVSNFNIDETTEFDAQLVNSLLKQTENNAVSSDENINSIEEMFGSNGIGSNNGGIDRNGDGNGLEIDLENICLNFGDNSNFRTPASLP